MTAIASATLTPDTPIAQLPVMAGQPHVVVWLPEDPANLDGAWRIDPFDPPAVHVQWWPSRGIVWAKLTRTSVPEARVLVTV